MNQTEKSKLNRIHWNHIFAITFSWKPFYVTGCKFFYLCHKVRNFNMEADGDLRCFGARTWRSVEEMQQSLLPDWLQPPAGMFALKASSAHVSIDFEWSDVKRCPTELWVFCVSVTALLLSKFGEFSTCHTSMQVAVNEAARASQWHHRQVQGTYVASRKKCDWMFHQ